MLAVQWTFFRKQSILRPIKHQSELQIYLCGAEITLKILTKTARLRYVLRRGYVSLPLRPLGIQARLCTVCSRHRPKRTVRRLLEQSSERCSESSNKVCHMPPSRKIARQEQHGLGTTGGPQFKHDCVHQRGAEAKSLRKAKVKPGKVDPPRYELTVAGRFAVSGTVYGWRTQWSFIVIASKSFKFSLSCIPWSDHYSSPQIDKQGRLKLHV